MHGHRDDISLRARARSRLPADKQEPITMAEFEDVGMSGANALNEVDSGDLNQQKDQNSGAPISRRGTMRP